MVGARHGELGVIGDLRGRLDHRAAVDGDEAVGDEGRRVGARARESARGEGGVEARVIEASLVRAGADSRRVASSSCTLA